MALGYQLEDEGRLLAEEETYLQLSHSASLMKGGAWLLSEIEAGRGGALVRLDSFAALQPANQTNLLGRLLLQIAGRRSHYFSGLKKENRNNRATGTWDLRYVQ